MSGGRRQGSRDAAEPIHDDLYMNPSRARFELVGNSNRSIVVVKNEHLEMDVIGGLGDRLLQLGKELFAIHNEPDRALLRMSPGVPVQPRFPLRQVHAGS